MEKFVRYRALPLVCFDKGQRQDEVAPRFRASFTYPKVWSSSARRRRGTVYRTVRRRNPRTKSPGLDRGVHGSGESLLLLWRGSRFRLSEVLPYFPYYAKLCLNGHEYLKRPLEQPGIPGQALDNGALFGQDPQQLPALADGLSVAQIEAPS